MKEVILTKGLPGSGKSTWACEQLKKFPGKYKRINKDSLRKMLDDSKFSRSNEKFVLELRDSLILQALDSGYHVIVDDTNFHPDHEERIKKLVKGKAKVRIEDFTNVSLNVCLERDAKREDSVGRKVIMRMYEKYLKPKISFKPKDLSKPPAFIFDVDGTLANMSVERGPYDWKKVGKDLLSMPVWTVCRALQAAKFKHTHFYRT